jgi:enoyl-CoA hydratase/carnithine racemase
MFRDVGRTSELAIVESIGHWDNRSRWLLQDSLSATANAVDRSSAGGVIRLETIDAVRGFQHDKTGKVHDTRKPWRGGTDHDQSAGEAQRAQPRCNPRILAVFEELRNDDEIAVVLTTGAGDVAYCAGRDLSEFPTEGGQNRGTDRRGQPRAYHVAEVIRTFPKVTIAVVNGFCLGAGITLLLPHDLAIASDKAIFGLPEIMRGFLPYPIIATMFKTLIPTKLAFELILTGQNWDAKKSLDAGLINRVVPHDQLQAEAWKWGEEIGKFDKTTLKYCKMAAARVDGSGERANGGGESPG